MRGRLFIGSKKGVVVIGLSLILSLVTLTPLLTSIGEAGCVGDCFSCHKNLIGSKEHASLANCFACHNEQKTSLSLKTRTNQDGGCGDRCFVCHIDWPKNSFHADLDNCLDCHSR